MGNCGSRTGEDVANDSIEKQIKNDRVKLNNEVKLLLLGKPILIFHYYNHDYSVLFYYFVQSSIWVQLVCPFLLIYFSFLSPFVISCVF